MKYLLDTCVISEVRKPSPYPAVAAWLENAKDENLFISVITLGELEKGALRLPEGRKRNDLVAWVREAVLQSFEGHILPIDERVALKWAEFQANAERQGRTLPNLDSLLAATAHIHDLTIVTRNNPDMEATGVPIFNPWTS